jgi:putative thioredoxin
VKLFLAGRPVDEFAGALPEQEIRAFLERHLPRPSDGTVSKAAERLSAGDTAGALTLLEQARAEDPDNPRILLTMAQVQAADGDPEAAEQTLAQLPPEEQEKPEARGLRGQLFFARTAAAAGPGDAAARRLAESPDDSEARFQLAAQQVVANDIGSAMDNLLLIVQKDRKFGDDAARLALLRLFDMLGDDPAVTRYRARMFNLLH